jgi:hypothetical protein
MLNSLMEGGCQLHGSCVSEMRSWGMVLVTSQLFAGRRNVAGQRLERAVTWCKNVVLEILAKAHDHFHVTGESR